MNGESKRFIEKKRSDERGKEGAKRVVAVAKPSCQGSVPYTHSNTQTQPCQPRTKQWRQIPSRAFCTEKFTKCSAQFATILLFMPPRSLRQGRWDLTEKVLPSRNRRFAKFAISCCQPTRPRSHTILPTAQQEMANAISCFGLTHSLPIMHRGGDRRNTVVEKNIES